MKIPSQILTAFRTCLLVSISAIAMTACSACSRTNAAKVSKAVENCDDQVWSELHSDVTFNSPGYSDRVKAIDSCGKAAIEGSALGNERLGIIFMLPESKASLQPSNLPLAIKSFEAAEELGSIYASYALAKVATSGTEGTEGLRARASEQQAKALAALQPVIESGSVAATRSAWIT